MQRIDRIAAAPEGTQDLSHLCQSLVGFLPADRNFIPSAPGSLHAPAGIGLAHAPVILTKTQRSIILQGSHLQTVLFAFSALALTVLPCSTATGELGNDSLYIPILVYHRFGPVVADSMTVTTPVFASQLKYLKENGYMVIPLRQFVAYRLGNAPPPPPHSVVITVDDAHQSVYSHMLPLVRQYRIPVTLFVYPSAISNASYALRWEQLRELKETGLFEIQSHTYWHPNFKQEKKRLPPEQYEKLVERQLAKAKETLESKLGIHVDMLSWPFGIYDDELIKKAVEVGYITAVTLDRRHASTSDHIMALPRYLMTDGDRGKAFERLLSGSSSQRKVGY
ncbi:MAG: polysaccharide deacetylase family protein [Deltaproteobacteria bacterium]|nr:polysaccharide deacetylase family protein [Deltaproteobacteria bacterium]